MTMDRMRVLQDDVAFERSLWKSIIRDGGDFPVNKEEIEVLTSLVSDSNIISATLPDFDDVLERGGGFLRSIETNNSDDNLYQGELSRAAREGGIIPKEIEESMKKDRESSENKDD